MEVDQSTVKADEVNNETSSEKAQNIYPIMGPSTTDMATEKMSHNKEGVAPFSILEFPTYIPSASSSKSTQNASTEVKKKEIKEFVRILRPHLPRKAKTKAYKILQNIAKGIVVESSFKQRITKKKLKKRSARKQKKPRQLKKLTKSLGIMRRNNRSLCSSSDSCQSNTSCPKCGHSCSRIARCRF